MIVVHRRYDKEIMDDRTITDGRMTRALDELRTINIMLGGNGTSRAGITILSQSPQVAPLTILDVGAGGSDTIAIPETGTARYEVIAVDINTGVCGYIKDRDRTRSVVCADAKALPFGAGSVDIVHVSLFLHHFTEDEIVRLLTSFLDIARVGIVINDLQRSSLALAGIAILTRIFSRSAMVINDAPLSVKKGFTRQEILSLLKQLPCQSYSLRWHWAFRWLAVIKK